MKLRLLAAAATLALGALSAQAQDAAANYPDKPIEIVVPFSPGGVNDHIARVTGERLEKLLGVSVVIQNKPGAGGRIAAQSVALAKPDGYTILLATSGSTVVVGAFDPKLPYDPVKDFRGIAKIADFPIGIFGRKDLNGDQISDLKRLNEEIPGGLKIGLSGSGSAGHLAAERLMHSLGLTGVKMVFFKGEAPSMLSLMSGDVDIAFAVTSPDPDLKVLATTGSERWSAYPDVKTVQEQGVEGYSVVGWAGLAVPSATPDAIVSKLEDAMRQVLADEDLLKSIRARGAEPSGLVGEAFDEQIKEELEGWKKLKEEIGLDPFG